MKALYAEDRDLGFINLKLIDLFVEASDLHHLYHVRLAQIWNLWILEENVLHMKQQRYRRLPIFPQHHLPEIREPLQKIQNNPPGKANIITTILDFYLNKNTNPFDLKQGALETVDSYSSVPIHVDKDGSAFKATIIAGAGVLLKRLDGTKYKYSTSCGKYISNNVAELMTINTAIQVIVSSEFTNLMSNIQEKIFIFTATHSRHHARPGIKVSKY